MFKLLTIIIPVYKVELYIHKCLDSLIVQDEQMEQLEVIIVNDGTPDRSAEIAHEYAKRYPRTFRVIDKENGGHGSAWNVGLQEAKGKYFRFLDSDDWFDTNNLVRLIEKLQCCDADIVFTPKTDYFSDDNIYKKRSYFTYLKEGQVYDADRFDWLSLGMAMDITNFHFCTYKTEMMKPHLPLFLEHQSYDDSILFIVPIIFAKSFVYYDLNIYYYLLGREGQTANDEARIKNYKHLENVKKQMMMFYKNHPVSSVGKKAKLDSLMNTIIWRHYDLLNCLSLDKRKQELKAWHDYLEKEYPGYRKSWKIRCYELLPFSLYQLIS